MPFSVWRSLDEYMQAAAISIAISFTIAVVIPHPLVFFRFFLSSYDLAGSLNFKISDFKI